MLKTPEINGARQELPCLDSPEIDGARQEVESVEKCVDGAWQEVWSSGLEPYGVYIYSSTYNSVAVEGAEIAMKALYSNRNSWARLIVPMPENITTLEFSIDTLMIVGIYGADSASKVSVNLYESDNIYTGALLSTDNYTHLGTLYTGVACDSWGKYDYSEEFAVSKKYLYIQFSFASGNYDADYSGNYMQLFLSSMRLNGKRIKGNLSI